MSAHRTSGAPRGEAGFTLVELLVVVVVIGILAAIGMPRLLGHRGKAQRATLASDLRNVSAAQEAHFVDHGAYTVDEAELALQGYERSADVGPLEITAYVAQGAPAYCVRASHELSEDTAWLSSAAGEVSRTSPDPAHCPAG